MCHVRSASQILPRSLAASSIAAALRDTCNVAYMIICMYLCMYGWMDLVYIYIPTYMQQVV